MSDDDEDRELTDAELATIAQGIHGLGLIDALVAALFQSLQQYGEEKIVAPRGTGIGNVLHDSVELVEAWQAFSGSPFGALFDPRVTGPEEEA